MSRLRYSTSDITSLETRTRSEHGFEETEASLRSSATKKLTASSKVKHLQSLFSYLGRRNPLPAPITKHDVVWLLDNVAFRGPGGHWHAEFVAAAFEGDVPAKFVDIVGDIAEKVGLAKGDAEEAVIERRIVPFVLDILPGRQVKAKFAGTHALKLGPGGRNGISSDLKRLPAGSNNSVAVTTADVPNGVTGILEMKTVFAEPEGWAVICGTKHIHPNQSPLSPLISADS